MNESQNIEWKETWRDDCLKWVCGFANAQGGVLEIGRADHGKVVGLESARRLLEELPNKVRDTLGIMVDVNLQREGNREYLQIRVDAYPNPISYKGEYYFRSGSTNQRLKGPALDRFLLGKTGRRWDGAPVPGVEVGDLDATALARFRERAARSKRLGPEVLDEDDSGLIEKLRLVEGRYLKRAAILLFHPDPERFFTGAAIKIGYFESDADLRYHDEVYGDLFTQVVKTMDLLLTKYLKAAISYEGIQRVETYPVPESALREAVLNAVVHRDYAVAAPIQIRVYADRLLIWNPGELPESWSQAKLLGPHPSRPFNPDVANAFFRSGEIEAWGRGIQRVLDACREAGSPEPRIQVEAGELWFEFPFSAVYLDSVAAGKRSPRASGDATQKTTQKATQKTIPDRILDVLREDASASRRSIADRLGGITVDGVKYHLDKLRDEGRIRRVGPDRGGHWIVLGGPDG